MENHADLLRRLNAHRDSLEWQQTAGKCQLRVNSDATLADLQDDCDFLGTTGWLWRSQRSLVVIFDIDSATGHPVGLTSEQMTTVVDQLKTLPYVEIRRSKGGLGVHAFVWLNDETQIANHAEHTCVARMVLAQMVKDLGNDVLTRKGTLDCIGSNIWVDAKGHVFGDN